jgi:hypothetical protein
MGLAIYHSNIAIRGWTGKPNKIIFLRSLDAFFIPSFESMEKNEERELSNIHVL